MVYIIILIITICIVCILVKNPQITGGYQQFTGERAIETKDSRFLNEQYDLEQQINTINKQFQIEYKDFLKNLKITDNMPNKYKRYIFHNIADNFKDWVDDSKMQKRDKYVKPHIFLPEKAKIIYILRGYIETMKNAYYGILDIKTMIINKYKVLIGPESISTIANNDRLYVFMDDIHDNFDNNYICGDVLMNRFDALLNMYETNNYDGLIDLYKRIDDLEIYSIDEYLYKLARGPDCIDIYIESNIIDMRPGAFPISRMKKFKTLLQLLFIQCFKYTDYKQCLKSFNNVRVHQVDVRGNGMNEEELRKAYYGGQELDQYYAFLNGENTIYDKYPNMNEIKKAYKKSFLYQDKKFFDAYMSVNKSSPGVLIFNMNIELYTIYRMTVAKYNPNKIGRSRCTTY